MAAGGALLIVIALGLFRGGKTRPEPWQPASSLVVSGLYRFTRNPMYLGHLIFLTGLAITFWSWFAVLILAARAIWFHRRVMFDERRLVASFGAEYDGYRARVKRWIPYLF